MEAGDWVAVYAALVGTAALAWQATTYALERRPKLRVDLTLVHDLESEQDRFAVAAQPETISTPWFLAIEVLNHGHSAVRVDRLAIETNCGPSGCDWWTSSHWGLPWVLESGEERVVGLTSEEIGTLSRCQKLTALAFTTHGREFSSETLSVGERGRGLELVRVPEDHFRSLLRRVGEEDRVFALRVHEFGGAAPLEPEAGD